MVFVSLLKVLIFTNIIDQAVTFAGPRILWKLHPYLRQTTKYCYINEFGFRSISNGS